MGCPAENTWLAYVGGELENAAIDRLEHHLDGCSSCRLVFAGLAHQDPGSAATAPAGEGPGLFGPPSGLIGDAAGLADLPRGTSVGRYLVVGPLGRGGMGVVYKAFDPELDRAVALKLVAVPDLGQVQAEGLRLRLSREARTLAQLSHPNVVSVFDVGSFEGSVFVAMEFVAGQTLRRWLARPGRTPREILGVFAAAGAGLAAAHRLGIVHRDFKPDNVMVADDGRVRVLDFGLARSVAAPAPGADAPPTPDAAADPDAGAAAGAPTHLTRDGTVMGTPAYMAPEQDRGEAADARSDQFSFCAALYEALYRKRPFAGTTYLELAARRADGDVAATPALRGLSARARRALLRGLCADPAGRHPDMDHLLAELGRGARLTRPRLAIAALAVAALAAVSWATWTSHHAPRSIAATCAAAGRVVDNVWSSARRRALEADFAASGHPRGAQIARQVAAAVDDWSAAWARERSRVCELAMRRDSQVESHAADRVQCLERKLGTLDASLAVYTSSPPPGAIDTAVKSFTNIPRPETCADLARPNPTDADKEQLRPVFRDIVQTNLAAGAGNYDRALSLARDAVERSRRLHSPAVAAGLLLLGQTQAAAGQLDQARKTLRQAVIAGARIKEDGIMADAWLGIIGLTLQTHRFDAGTEEAIFGARLAVMRLPPGDDRQADLPYRIGSARVVQGDLDAAERELDRALAMYRKLGERTHLLQISAVENSLGLVDIYRGKWTEVDRNLSRALAGWKSILPNRNIGITLGNMATALQLRHHYAEAQAGFERALDAALAAPDATPATLGEAVFNLGFILVERGRCREAAPYVTVAQALLGSVHGTGSGVYAMIELARGRCALERGDAAGAALLLDGARETAIDQPISPMQVPMIDVALARAEARRGRHRRAVRLAEEARDAYARVPGLSADLADVDRLLAAERRR